ncbi:MAG: hypothetical protein K2O02_00660, partial [Lachnospiraceae bacterium]|nr:hypothetical protein [Lachnospiraceae bacterium]
GVNGEITLEEIGNRTAVSEEDKDKLIPNVEIFKEIMVELIKNREIDIEILKKERSEYIQDQQPEFQLNEMVLHLTDVYPEYAEIMKIETYRVEDGTTVRFENVQNEKGERKSILCSNVIIRVIRED